MPALASLSLSSRPRSLARAQNLFCATATLLSSTARRDPPPWVHAQTLPPEACDLSAAQLTPTTVRVRVCHRARGTFSSPSGELLTRCCQCHPGPAPRAPRGQYPTPGPALLVPRSAARTICRYVPRPISRPPNHLSPLFFPLRPTLSSVRLRSRASRPATAADPGWRFLETRGESLAPAACHPRPVFAQLNARVGRHRSSLVITACCGRSHSLACGPPESEVDEWGGGALG
ncbi:hypothetical protein C8Q79DRAFT_714893 [Trametes meyenii]|nr:hypothetical protein C8Q79DRAFT_714893 [Trametes meyenii]